MPKPITGDPYYSLENLVTLPDGTQGLGFPEGGFKPLDANEIAGLLPLNRTEYTRAVEGGSAVTAIAQTQD